ncbi:fumarylacetoacetate hydrolase family protein [Nostoc sp. NMS7]|uniref:fumarylacetoacetate hydrolase family protein n=1 Tax=Nostoc sp. NMS7 TaxID=2815391 RepID=UPI00345ACA40
MQVLFADLQCQANLTIKPGDMLFTGSPSGSAGVDGDRFLKASDRIHAEIDIGSLNVIIRQD